MRAAFIDTLCDLAENDPRIWLLTGDLGFSVLEKFQNQWPDRFVNTGIAEQNMAGVAAGLASCGSIVFIYSIANFPTFRCLEQIRNDIAYHGLNVKIVSVGAGFAYGTAGYTHHGIEDVAVMRAIPGMTVVAPGDAVEAALATEAIARRSGPAYLRLGKAGEAALHAATPNFEIGKAILVREGNDLTLISTGSMLRQAVICADALLQKHHLCARVLSMPSIKPLDVRSIRNAATETRGILVLEEHRVIGGLGSAVAEVLASMKSCRAPLRVWGIPDRQIHTVGSQEFLVKQLGDVTDLACEMLDRNDRTDAPVVPLNPTSNWPCTATPDEFIP